MCLWVCCHALNLFCLNPRIYRNADTMKCPAVVIKAAKPVCDPGCVPWGCCGNKSSYRVQGDGIRANHFLVATLLVQIYWSLKKRPLWLWVLVRCIKQFVLRSKHFPSQYWWDFIGLHASVFRFDMVWIWPLKLSEPECKINLVRVTAILCGIALYTLKNIFHFTNHMGNLTFSFFA